MGLHLEIADPVWGCFRNDTHRGANPRRLVQKLLQCSFKHALEIVREQQGGVDDFEDAAEQLKDKPPPLAPEITTRTFLLPKGSKPITDEAYGVHFLNYLRHDRGFGPDADAVVSTFRIHYNLASEWVWRLMIPFYVDEKLVGWTGRDIRPNAKLRYRTMSGMSKDLIYNVDLATAAALHGAETLWIVEGPLDTMKMHFYGTAAVGVLGTALTGMQIALLVRLLKHFRYGVVMFDADMYSGSIKLAEELQVLSGRKTLAQRPPAGFHDPGEMGPSEIRQATKQVTTLSVLRTV